MRTKVGAVLAGAAVAGGVFYAGAAAAGASSAADLNKPVATTTAGGSAAPAAAPPPRVFAVINSSGNKLRGKAVASTSHVGSGVYDVRFLRNITGCAWTGTVGDGSTPFGGSEPSSTIIVSGRSGTNNGLFVQTYNGSGAPTDLPFNVVVVCG